MPDNSNNKPGNIIEPAIPAGFQEYLPREQMLFSGLREIIRKSFESYGFIPLDTPVLEKAEVLLAKSGGETGKQIYRFQKGDADLAMRFDLTVPLARYVAQHSGELTFPFRRYQIGKVYRGERPQKGRFREFYQCDIDIIGNETLSLIHEAEIVSIINTTFEALNFGEFTVMLNNRKLLTGFFEALGVVDPVEALRIVDKLDKIGPEKTAAELCGIGISADSAERIIRFTSLSGAPETVVPELEQLCGTVTGEMFAQGVRELKEVTDHISAFGVPHGRVTVNLKIARGLDYYTGTVYETVLNDYPGLGSICSGGRYEDLASNYTKLKLPGVGISIGLSRLFYQLLAAGILNADKRATPSRLLFIPMGDTLTYTLGVADKVRSFGIPCETYLGTAKLGKKFGYADKLGIPYAAVIGEDEMNTGVITVKCMETGVQTAYGSVAQLVSELFGIN